MLERLRNRRWTVGIRGRLLFAFLAISAFVVLAALAAVQALLQVASLVGEVTEHRTPAIITSLSMSREVERLVGSTQELAEIGNRAVFEQKSRDLAQAGNELQVLVARLVQLQGEPVEILPPLVTRLRDNVAALDGTIRRRLDLADRKLEVLRDLRQTDLLFQQAMLAPTRTLASDATRLSDTLARGDQIPSVRPEQITGVLQLNAAQALQVAFARTHDLLLIASSSANQAEFELNRITVRRALDELDRAGSATPPLFSPAIQIAARLHRFAEADDGVLAIRGGELAELQTAERLVEQNGDMSQALVSEVDALVQSHARSVQESMEETRRVRDRSMRRLILVAAASLGFSILIFWFYVNRHIGVRLAAVGDSMLALAKGRLRIALPEAGRDEIGQMASALAVFQQTALEAEEREALLGEAKERAEQAREAADWANRSKSEFLANMSHEIRTPINAIAGFTSLALRTELSPRQAGYLHKVHAATQGLLRVINDLLDFSKIEAGHLEMERIPFRLSEVIDSVMSYIGTLAEGKGLELLIAVAPDVPAQLIGDPFRLGQVLSNLCSNAVKFTERGEIELRVAIEDGTGGEQRLLFAVRDTGIGLSADQAAKLFQPFTQADSSTTRKFGGTGLGLVISQRLIAMMNGRIWLDSTPGAGTTFFFTVELPAVIGDFQSPPMLPNSLRGKAALIVDDNATARQILQAQLVALGMRPRAVADGEAALTVLRDASSIAHPYPLVLMDWKMPGMDGLAVTQAIRRDPAIAGTPVIIMVTAHGREQAIDGVAEAELLDGVLLKPVTQSLLADTLCRLMAADAAGEKLSTAPRQDRLHGARLLVVEDNPISQQLAAEMLEQEGAEVQIAGNGRLALELLELLDVGYFDAALIDLQMPEMDGFDTAKRIRLLADGVHLPLIAITVHALAEDRERCIAAGMQDHIAKPVDRELLIATLMQWIGADALARARARRHDEAASRGDPRSGAAELDRLLDRFGETLGVVTSGLAPLTGQARMPRRGGDGAALAGLDGFNVAQGLHRVGGDAAFYRKLIGDLRRTQADAPDRLAAALAAGERDRLADIAHLVRGLSANLSAERVAEAAAKIEAAAPHESAESLLGLIAVLRDAFAEIAGSVDRLESALPSPGRAVGGAGGSAEQRPPDPAGPQSPRILVVDDVPANLFVIGKMLQSLGVRATMAASGAEALSAIDAAPFDLVITDCQMPDMSGFELAATIRAEKDGAERRTVIVGVSANTDDTDRERCLTSGMDGFLGKPLSAEALGRVLEQWRQGVTV